ncbi:glutamine synthetase [Ktedonosporobacter rubrisoli]|uniref:Glutamine synthetase n=1 Tax=Ktedonosporobacter rubrisoli TaxID=2509675 RepID=A0A4V0YZQ8_KTERU|nr:glutamine synthetase family protein [Ktedonosporobacter rubrisoli]QBD80571.1 glutamine synthetase [Ktedonosporobacter rubrisoli]
MNAQDVLRLVRAEKLRLIRFQYCDNGGLMRCKTTHASKLATRIYEGIGQSLALGAWTGADTLASVEGMGAVGEFRLVPDPDSFAILPYVPNTGSLICNLIDVNGQPWGADPRGFLRRMIARLADKGMRFEAAAEHEFYFAREEMGKYVPADRSLCYSTIGLDEQALVMDAVLEALESQGISIEQFHTELGPSQQELSIHHADALRAADNICLVRETIRGVARTFNLLATFAPKPFLDQAGSGAHIHFSLWGTAESEYPNKNLFYASEERGHLSQTGRYFIGGVLRHIRALLALTCGSVNSYSRLQPHYWSSAYGAWGFDNREAAIRVPSTFWGRETDLVNLEIKSADHSGNPYLAIGGLIAAGLDGIENKIEPNEPQDVDPGNLTDAERERLGIQRLPTSLDESLDELERDHVLIEALGPMLSTAYLAVKRDECNFFKDKTPEEVAIQHFYKF